MNAVIGMKPTQRVGCQAPRSPGCPASPMPGLLWPGIPPGVRPGRVNVSGDPPCLAGSVHPAVGIQLQGSRDFVMGQGTTAGELTLSWRKWGSEKGPERLWAEALSTDPMGEGQCCVVMSAWSPQHD